ncbi:MAG: glycosyltransferase family 4 protein [Pelolinea sp.]|nr:glycosyltransferase family 4 protein [Pelolinea sp.]
MNIGIVTTWFERGAAYVSKAYFDTLSKQHRVFIYARGGESFGIGDPYWDTPNVRWTAPGSVEINRDDFEQWIYQHHIKLILFNEQEHWWQPVIWANEFGVHTVSYVDYYTPRMIRWFSIYDAVWCNTKRHYSVFKWHPRAQYIPWGTDTNLFRPQNHASGDELVFFHSAGMGGLNLRKGTDLLVRAFEEVSGPARLIIHSQVPVENYGEEIAELIRTDTRIRFIELTVKAPGLYHLGDVYVYPTRLDGIGLSFVEALSCGLPVMTTDTAPCNEFIIHGVNGWLVPVEKIQYRKDKFYWPETECNIHKLAEQMQFCVDDRNHLSLWQNNAENYAKEHLNWDKNSTILNDEVNTILSLPMKKVPLIMKWDIINYQSNHPSLAWKLYWRLAQAVHIFDHY